MNIYVRKRRWWWEAYNADEAIGMFDRESRFRRRTRQKAIDACRRAFNTKESPWEQVKEDTDQ